MMIIIIIIIIIMIITIIMIMIILFLLFVNNALIKNRYFQKQQQLQQWNMRVMSFATGPMVSKTFLLQKVQ